MTIITDEQRQRLLKGPETEGGETAEPTGVVHPEPRSGIMASLVGMLAGLGMLTILSAIAVTAALLSGFELDFVGEPWQVPVVTLAAGAMIVLTSTFIGGFVAGRVARYGGMATGVGSTLWLVLTLAALGGLALLVNEFSPLVEGFDITERIAVLEGSDFALAGAIAAGGLLLLSLGMGLLGGRLGETERAVGAHEEAEARKDVAAEGPI